MTQLAERLAAVDVKIAEKLASLGRSPSEVTRIVVTKNHPVTLARELYDLGCRDFGENRDQEAFPKAEALSELIPADSGVQWHFIGQLQSNKVKNVVQYASSIHSIDRQSLLDTLTKQLATAARKLDVFIQVNLTHDSGRGGVLPADLESFAEAVSRADNLNLKGLMAVAGLGVDPAVDFERVAGYSAKLQQSFPAAKSLSIGMSEDFETALEFGATHLRIGTAITGKRA